MTTTTAPPTMAAPATKAPTRRRHKYERNDRLMRRHGLRSAVIQLFVGLAVGAVALPLAYGYGFRGTMAGMNFAGVEQAFVDKPSIQYPEMLVGASFDRDLIQPLGPTPLFDLQTPEGMATQAVYELGPDDPAALLRDIAATWRAAGLRVGTIDGRLVATAGDGSDHVYTAAAMPDRDALVVSAMGGQADETTVAFERLNLPAPPPDATIDFMGSIAAGFSIDYTMGGHPDDAFDALSAQLAARDWRPITAASASFSAPGQGVFQRGPSRLTVATDFSGDTDTRVSLVLF